MFNYNCFRWAGNVCLTVLITSQLRATNLKSWVNPRNNNSACVWVVYFFMCDDDFVQCDFLTKKKMVDVWRWSLAARDYVTVTHTQVTHKRIAILKEKKPQQPQRAALAETTTTIHRHKYCRLKKKTKRKAKIKSESKRMRQNEIENRRNKKTTAETQPETNQALFTKRN